MKYSLAKIADELGVSKATVSLVLNGKARKARISADVEQRIKNFCREVNYIPNIHAQRINRKFAKNIGFLVNQSARRYETNPFSDYNVSEIMGGIALAADDKDFRVTVQLYDGNMDESRVFDWLRNHEIDGLIYYGMDMPEKWIDVFVEEQRNVVGIGIRPHESISGVNINNFECAKRLTESIISSGRTKLMYISGIDGSYVSDERKNGFLTACAENGITLDEASVISAEFSEKLAENAVLENSLDVDAIICANDDMAIGVLKALKKIGVDVPGKIAVAGADNIVLGQYFTPSLTTFSNMQRELGIAAFDCLMRMINGGKNESIVLKSCTVERESAQLSQN